jgi:hypothetical protein
MPHLGGPDGLPHLPENDDDGKGGRKAAADKGPDRIPGDTADVEKDLGKQDDADAPAETVRELAGDTVDKPGSDLTDEDRDAENAAIDAAYGDPAPDMDEFVAAEERPDGATPGSGTVGGATRDEIDPAPANEARFNTAMRGLDPEGRKVTDADSLRKEIGEKYADQLLSGRGIPARYAASMLDEPDTRALFGKTPDELRAMGDKRVKWALADSPEQVVAPHVAPKPVTDGPPVPSVPGEPGEAKPRGEAFDNAEGEWATIPVSDLKPGDLVWRNGKTWAVTDVRKRDAGDMSVSAERPEGGRESYGGWGGPIEPDRPMQVHVPVGRAIDKGKNGKAERTKRRKAEDAVAQHQHELAMADRLEQEGGLLDAPNEDGTVNAGPKLPLSKWHPEEQLGALANADAVVSGVTKDGQPFLGQIRLAGGAFEVDAPDGTPMPLNPREIESMRLVSGEVAMPAAESVPAHRLRPGTALRSGFEYGDQGQPIQPVYRVVSAEPGKPLRVVDEDGKERTIGKDSSDTSATPITRHTAEAATEAAPAPVEDAPQAPTPEADAPEAPIDPLIAETAPEAPEADVTPDAPAEPTPPRAPTGPARTDADMFAPEPEPADEPDAGEPAADPAQEWDGRGASTLPRKPEAPAVEQGDAPEQPAADRPQAPAVVRPMDRVDDVPTAEEPITGRRADWVTPDALQIGDYARLEGMDGQGNPIEAVGYLANDPQPAEFQPADGGPATDVLGVLLSEKMDGLGETTMVWVPLDRLAALAPRPEADEVVPDGEQVSNAKAVVRDGKMPTRIPTDSTGKLGLFPRSLVKDVDGQREGIVIAARGEDVSVRWGSGEVEDVAGSTVTITDGGIQRPAGWTRDGKQRRGPRPGQKVTAPNPAQQKPIKPESAEQAELFEVVRNEADDFVKKVGDHLSGKKRMTPAEFDRTLQGMLRKHLKESQARRVQYARRAVARRPYRPGLLAQLVTALADLTAMVLKAIIATLRWLFSQNNREWAAEHGQRAARAIARRAKESAESQRVQRLLGVTDDAPAGGVDDLMDTMI